MRKAIYLFVITAFVLGLAAFKVTRAAVYDDAEVTTTAAEVDSELEGLEKIPSPDQIKDFKVMRRVGNALYGIRRAASVSDQNKSDESKSDEVKQGVLERITHPAFVNLFEKIQRVGNALWGVRKHATSTPETFVIPAEVAICVAAAIDVKDKALMDRVSVAAAELNTALAARSTCQQDAIKASTTPKLMLNTCIKTFDGARKAMVEKSKNLQKEIWNAYQVNLKACRATSSDEVIPTVEDGGSLFE